MNEAAPQRSLGWVVGAAMLVSTLMISQQIAGKAIRDAYFLTVFEAEVLPRVMTVASVLSVISVLGVTRLYRRFAPASLVPAFFFASAAWFAGEWALSRVAPQAAATSLYIHTTSFGAVAISGFWSVINERFDPHTAKRVIGKIAGGATFGGVLGGLIAWQGAGAVSIPGMMLGLCVVNLLCGVGLFSVGGPDKPPATEDPKPAEDKAPDSAWSVFEETPYLFHLALLVFITALGTAGFDYVFKATAAQTYTHKPDLVSFFALFYLGTGLLTFIFQNALAGSILKKLGLTASIGTLSGSILIFGVLALLSPGLWTVIVLRGGAATIESSLYRSGYELLYTPLSPQKKRPTKALIDVGGDKLGAALGGAIAVFLVGLAPSYAASFLIAVSVLCAVGGLALTGKLARGYVQALSDSLASGTLAPQEVSLLDPQTQEAVEKTMAALDRQAFLQRSKATAPTLSVNLPAAGIAPQLPQTDPSGAIRARVSLESSDPSAITWALTLHTHVPPQWVPQLIPLLAKPEVAQQVGAKLAQIAPAHVGGFVDALLNRRTPLDARHRLVDLLARVPTERSALGLLFALRTEPFSLRFHAAGALRDVHHKNPVLTIDPAALFDAAQRELNRVRLEGLQLTAQPKRAGQYLAYCLLLLSVTLDQEALYLAVHALGSEDRGRRGTGMEYMENVLPPELKAQMLPFLEQPVIARHAHRNEFEVLQEIRTGRRGVGSLEQLRALVRKRHAR